MISSEFLIGIPVLAIVGGIGMALHARIFSIGSSASPPVPPTPGSDALLLETGDYMLQETGDFILLE